MSPLQRRLAGWAVGLAMAAGILTSLWLNTETDQPPELPPAAIERLFGLPFKDPSGTELTLRHWQGKTLVVNFWATWCPPCRQEMPAFSRLHTKLADRGVVFIGIGIDSPSAIKEYALQSPVSYPLLIGGSEGLELLKTLGNPHASLPYTMVIDPSGQPVMSRLGMIEEASFEQRLLALLAPAAR